jgi:hypothetical protein
VDLDRRRRDFSLVNSGLSVTSGIIDADTAPLSAVIVSGTGVLGYGWNTAPVLRRSTRSR